SMQSGPVGGKATYRRKIFPDDAGTPAVGALLEQEALAAGAKAAAGGNALAGALAAAPLPPPQPDGTARNGLFNGVDFFPSNARLLGIVPLGDIVKAALYAQAPQLIEEAEAAAEDLAGQVETLKRDLNAQIERALSGLDRL